MANFNFISSSWPSAGGTTLALNMADILDLKYIYAGGVWKEWAKRAGYDPASNEFHEFETKYGEAWDYFWEDYIKSKLTTETGLLCEGKTTGFLCKNPKAFSVMVTASAEVRSQRAHTDMRTEQIIARDRLLSERWQRLFGVDIFSHEQITEKYTFELDNSNLTIADAIIIVTGQLRRWLDSNNLSDVETNDALSLINLERAKVLEAYYWNVGEDGLSGKDKLKQKLVQKNCYYTNEMIFAEWKEKYSDRLAQLPAELQAAL